MWIESTIVIKPEAARRIYWTMVSIDTFGLVGATSAPCHALSASVWMACFVIAQTADGAMIFEAKQHLFVRSMRIKTGPKSCSPVDLRRI
jgi:hypothetical protein